MTKWKHTGKKRILKPFVITRALTKEDDVLLSPGFLVVHEPMSGRPNVYTVYEIPGYEKGNCCQAFKIVGRELTLKYIKEYFGKAVKDLE